MNVFNFKLGYISLYVNKLACFVNKEGLFKLCNMMQKFCKKSCEVHTFQWCTHTAKVSKHTKNYAPEFPVLSASCILTHKFKERNILLSQKNMLNHFQALRAHKFGYLIEKNTNFDCLKYNTSFSFQSMKFGSFFKYQEKGYASRLFS